MQTIGISPPEADTHEITITILIKLQFWLATIAYKHDKYASISPFNASLVPVHYNDIAVKFRKFEDPLATSTTKSKIV